MTKEVLIKIRGLQLAEESGDEPVEVITSGDYYRKDGKHYIIYDEVTEGSTETTKNIIKVNETCLDITKRGSSNVHMLFEKNKKNTTCYYTPYGNIMVGIDARRMEVEETADKVCIRVDYILDVNYEYMADCRITMDILSKNTGDFHI